MLLIQYTVSLSTVMQTKQSTERQKKKKRSENILYLSASKEGKKKATLLYRCRYDLFRYFLGLMPTD